MINQRGIEANPEKIRVLLEMSSHRKPKEVIGLTGRVANTKSIHVASNRSLCTFF